VLEPLDPELAALGARLALAPATPPPARAEDPAAAVLAALWDQIAAHGSLPMETVYYAHHGRAESGQDARPVGAAMAVLARLSPALEVVAFEARCPRDEVDEILAQLPRMFRQLRRIEIPKALLRGAGYTATVERYRSLPLVVLV